jgi:hypothetical protein
VVALSVHAEHGIAMLWAERLDMLEVLREESMP